MTAAGPGAAGRLRFMYGTPDGILRKARNAEE